MAISETSLTLGKIPRGGGKYLAASPPLTPML